MLCWVWFGMVWYAVVWKCMVCCSVLWYGMACPGMSWCGMVWHAIVQYGTVCHTAWPVCPRRLVGGWCIMENYPGEFITRLDNCRKLILRMLIDQMEVIEQVLMVLNLLNICFDYIIYSIYRSILWFCLIAEVISYLRKQLFVCMMHVNFFSHYVRPSVCHVFNPHL